MKKIDKDGLLMCEIQGKIFEKSLEYEKCSSSIFIRRYMNSKICKKMDDGFFLNELYTIEQVFHDINDEYGVSVYGKEKFLKNEMYWMGYIYRYFAYVYEWNSSRIYKLINAKDLKMLYFSYHTLDPLNAIERILEVKDVTIIRTDEETIKLGVKILRELRNNQ